MRLKYGLLPAVDIGPIGPIGQEQRVVRSKMGTVTIPLNQSEYGLWRLHGTPL
jgi:hypothetical protein